MKNEKHFVNVKIPELDFKEYFYLLYKYAEVKGNLSEEDSLKFKELSTIFYDTFQNIK